MDSLGPEVRSGRRRKKLSQPDLARAAGVSLATIQNIESGRANPSLSTLTRVLAPLGLGVEIGPIAADRGALIALGLPLSGAADPLPVRDLSVLRHHVERALDELEGAPGAAGAERLRDCLQALALALRLHFPSATSAWFETSPRLLELVAQEPPGRVIKLYRIALARVAEYL